MFDIRRTLGILCSLAVLSVSFAATAPAQEVRDVPVLTGPAGIGQVTGSGEWLAWSQNTRRHPNSIDVFAKRQGGRRFKVYDGRGRTSLGGLDGSRLVYQQFRSGRRSAYSQIRIANLAKRTDRALRAVNSRQWEFWPSISGRWVLYGRTYLRRGITKILLTDLRSGDTRVLDKGRAVTYFQPGQVNGNFAVWMKWRRSVKPRMLLYDIAARDQIPVPTGDRYNWAPSVSSEGVVYFARSGRACGSGVRLVRWERGRDEITRVRFPDGIDMSDSYVSTTGGTVQVVHNRLRCDSATGGDLYRLIEGEAAVRRATLTVTKAGRREGTVTSSPTGIDCGEDCSEAFEAGEQVTLTGVEGGRGSRFQGWSHPDCPGTDPCTITLEQDTTVTATFD